MWDTDKSSKICEIWISEEGRGKKAREIFEEKWLRIFQIWQETLSSSVKPKGINTNTHRINTLAG